MQKDIVAEENEDPKLGSDLNGDFSGLGFMINNFEFNHYDAILKIRQMKRSQKETNFDMHPQTKGCVKLS